MRSLLYVIRYHHLSIIQSKCDCDMQYIPQLFQAYNVKETIAVSGQFMNRNNYRVIMEELFRADQIQRTQLPSYVDSMGPQDQVEY